MNQAKKLRDLLNKEGVILAPCAYDALTARAVAAAGFDLVTTTGFGIHGVRLGVPDMGLITMTEVADQYTNICATVDLPVLADADGGWGNATNIYRTTKTFERTGLAGLFLEDQDFPPNCPFISKTKIVSCEEMVGKIKAAVAARNDPDFVIVARTDAPFDEAIERVRAYTDAGADMIKIIPKTKEELLKLPTLVDAPLHLGLVAGKGINDNMTAQDMGKLGYKIVTFPMSCLFASTYAIMAVLKEIKEHGTDEGLMDRMVDFNDYVNLVGKEYWSDIAKKYVAD